MVRRIDNEGATVWTATFGTSEESVGYSMTQVTTLTSDNPLIDYYIFCT